MQIEREQIRDTFEADDRFPPILDPKQAADLLQVSLATIYRYSSEGRFSGAVRRGRPLRFWRDGLIEQFFHEKPRRSGWRRARAQR